MINVFQPSLGDEELEAVREVFRSNWIGRGRRVEAFEQQFAGLCGVPASSMIATTCASEGLFVAPEVLGWGPGDEIIIATIGFVAAASAVCRVGATPVFCDVDPHSLNARVEDIARVRTARTKGVVINHYGGLPARVDEIAEYCAQHGIGLVEDAACAIGASVGGRAVGTFGSLSVWSFDSMKILVTGDGGMIYARPPALARAVREATYLGMPPDGASGIDRSQTTKGRWWEYEIGSFGRRAIMNDVTAAIGLVQLKRLPEFLARRAAIADRYTAALRETPGVALPPAAPPDTTVTRYLYWIQLDRRDELADHLKSNGVYTTFRYWPLHKVSKFGSADVTLPNAERAAAITLDLPCHQALTDQDVDRIAALIRGFVSSRAHSGVATVPR